MSERRLGYELDAGLLDQIAREFDPATVARGFAAAVAAKGGNGNTAADEEGAAKEVFGPWGEAWIRRTSELAEERSDQTYEILKAAMAKTPSLKFPHVPQRVIEAAYLAVQPVRELNVVENNTRRIVFRVADCSVFGAVREACGENATAQTPCRHACLAALTALHADLGIAADVAMDAAAATDGRCEFRISAR